MKLLQIGIAIIILLIFSCSGSDNFVCRSDANPEVNFRMTTPDEIFVIGEGSTILDTITIYDVYTTFWGYWQINLEDDLWMRPLQNIYCQYVGTHTFFWWNTGVKLYNWRYIFIDP